MNNESKVVKNTGEKAVFDDGSTYPRGMIVQEIGYLKIISLEAFREIFAVGSTLSGVKERLRGSLPSPDGVPEGTFLPSPTRVKTNQVRPAPGEWNALIDSKTEKV
jgi:hypothetical protein